MKSLLLISCSSRKSKLSGTTTAVERYDGGTYRVIRKARRLGTIRGDLEIKIISAKFGLIDERTAIPYYNLRMDGRQVQRLKPQIHEALQLLFQQQDYCEIYVDLGKRYLPVLEGLEVPANIHIQHAVGRIGERLHALKAWLSI